MDAVIVSDCSNGENNTFLYRYIGPYKIAHVCRSQGYSAQVIDFVMSMTYDTLLGYLRKFVNAETKMVALSATFLCQVPARQSDGSWARAPEHVIQALRQIKIEFPQAKYVLGGYMSEHLDGFGFIDCRVLSNAEAIMAELINYFAGVGEEPQYKLQKPSWKRAAGLEKMYYAPRNAVYNIETDNFSFHEQDCIVEGETLPLEVSRGCVFKCKFCNHENLGRPKLDYLRSMDCIRAELINNYERWGVTNYNVLCDTFNDTEIKLRRWHEMVTSLPFKIKFAAYIRVDLIHRFPDMAHLLQEGGLHAAFHGLESLHPEASRIVGKAWSGKHAREYIPELYHNIWGGQVHQHLNFIVGLPSDSIESMESTADWVIQNQLQSASFGELYLVKGSFRHLSEFERNAEQYGYTFDDTKIQDARVESGDGSYNKYWKLDYIDFEKARLVARSLNRRIGSHVGPMNWTILSALSVGMPESKINVKRIQFSLGTYATHKLAFIQRYLTKLNGISA